MKKHTISTDMEKNADEDMRYRPDSGLGEYSILFVCGTLMGLPLGFLSYLAYQKWPEWWFIEVICATEFFLIGIMSLTGLVIRTGIFLWRCLMQIKHNGKKSKDNLQ